MNILILAGGSGTRLWPASRKAKPKQLLPFIGDKTLLQNTYQRCLKATRAENIFVGTLTDYAPSVRKQLPGIPKQNYSLETTLRDRGPAIGLAALIMEHYQPGSNFVTAWSDHYIQPEKKYLELLKKAEKYLSKHPETTITVGAVPTFPHPGLGYIHRGDKVMNNIGLDLYEVRSFQEKPSPEVAKLYVQSGEYLWNAAYFMWNTTYLLSLYRRYLPEIYGLLEKIRPALGTSRQQAMIDKIYPKMPKMDIETGLIEKLDNRTDNRLVVQADFGWSDIGSWRVIKEVLSKNEENLISGLWIGIDTEDSLIYNYTNKLVSTSGLKNCVVVVTDDVVLVADKNNSEEIKKLINILESNSKLRKFL